MDDDHRHAFHAYRRFLAVGVCLLLIGGALLAWPWDGPDSALSNGPDSALVAKAPPFVIERQADGSWPPIPSDNPGFAWSPDVSTHQSNPTLKSSSATSIFEGARLASRSVAVFNTSTEPLADLIARGVIAGLQEDGEIERISYAPKNGSNAPGDLAPDIVITIGVDEQQQDAEIANGTTRSSVTVTMSDTLAQSLSASSIPWDAPRRIQFSMNLTGDIDIEQGGLATPNARLKATAAGLSKGILDKIRDRLSEMRLAHGTFPELPATFYPEYEALDESQFDIGNVFAADEPFRQLASWRNRFIHNTTWWHGTVAGDRQTSVARIGKRLIDAGFTTTVDDEYDHTFGKGSIEVELILDPTVTIGAKTKPPESTEMHVRFTHRVDQGVRRAALGSVMTDGSSDELLMMCAPFWDKEQDKRGGALIEALDLRNPSPLLQRAKMRHRRGDEEGAADDLARAATFANTGLQRGETFNKVKEQAEEWQVTFADKLLDRDWLRGIGLIEVAVDADPIELEVTPESPFRGFHFHNELVTAITVGLQRDKDGQWAGACRATSNVHSKLNFGYVKGRAFHQIGSISAMTEFLDDPADGKCRIRIQLR